MSEPGQIRRKRDFPRLLSERLCLDFANTIDSRIGPKREEFLFQYADLVEWSAYAGVLNASRAERLIDAASREPEAARETFARAIDFREAIYAVFRAIAGEEQPSQADLDMILSEFASGARHVRLAPVEARFELIWPEDDLDLACLLWPIARSAVELLSTGDFARLRECSGADNDCGWLFYDVSKNGQRRWCSMEGCGSQAKMRRYRARGKEAAT